MKKRLFFKFSLKNSHCSFRNIFFHSIFLMKNDHLFNEKQPFFRCVSISRTRCVSNGHLTQYFVKKLPTDGKFENVVEKYENE